MNLKDQILKYLLRPLVERNKQFNDRHKGETCYIIGNGASLKNMDISVFSNHVSIGINHLCLHKEFEKLDIQYYTLVEPLFLYPYCKNPYTKQYQKNILGNMFVNAFSKYPEVNLFTSVSNFLGSTFKNTYYLHHFGHRQPNSKVCDISQAFSFMAGGLYSAIGIAISMGFKKAILVGCDYTFSPMSHGHFYAAGPPVRSDSEKNVYGSLLSEINGIIELSTVTDTGGSKWLPSQTYEEFTGKKISYRENTDIVSPKYLDMLCRALELKQYGSPIYTKA